jgi:hypothetical protein
MKEELQKEKEYRVPQGWHWDTALNQFLVLGMIPIFRTQISHCLILVSLGTCSDVDLE